MNTEKNMKNLWKTDEFPSNKIKRVHMIGASGLGMQALKVWLQAKNYTISETDDYNSHPHMISANEIPKSDCLIVSSVISKDHPQCIWAIKNNIPIFHRASFAKYLSNEKESICVSGTHGKTTTSGLITWIMHCAKLNPSFMLGDKMQNLNIASLCVKNKNSNKDLINNDLDDLNDNYYDNELEERKEEICIIESDESDGSMQKLTGDVNVITNIDEDHMDYYENRENIAKSFKNFALSGQICICHQKAKEELNIDSVLTYSLDSKNTNSLYENIKDSNHSKSFDDSNSSESDYFDSNNSSKFDSFDNLDSNTSSQSDVYAKNIKFHQNGMMFDVCGLIEMHNVYLNMLGMHNIENALAAICVAVYYNIDEIYIRNALSSFQGMKKRLEVNQVNNIDYMLDYAHHPHSIKLLFDTLINYKYSKIYCILEIHKYSRLKKDFNLFIREIANLCNKINTSVAIMPIHNVKEDFDINLENKFYESLLRKINTKNSNNIDQENRNIQIKSRNTQDQINALQDFINDIHKSHAKQSSAKQEYANQSHAKQNDLVLFIGAGEVCKLYYKFIKHISL
ncbi:hypothetical protein FZC35_01245 [Candidatus Cytomitobacter indipagum]|uniref:Mur ligase central domain-containing protein n=1 Tax=Candidatus Cytomitobacter indipagum TaxID=2601575 RepID=A0A5C0UEC4_9PROT|nr:Mur ligase family protein [Candidatus Cytomitobacter indipagum]QEK38003.1 hypothetical protein FZC35_01245 [Candidatus Cytomitobacter indipagum]